MEPTTLIVNNAVLDKESGIDCMGDMPQPPASAGSLLPQFTFLLLFLIYAKNDTACTSYWLPNTNFLILRFNLPGAEPPEIFGKL